MKRRKAKFIKDPKLRGEWAESVFMARAGECGLVVSRPWGDSNTFDFVVGRPKRFVSVQVKSTTALAGGGYTCAVRKQGNAYSRGSFDYLAAYVVLEDVWYIIPADNIVGKKTVILCSNSEQAKYEQYREAWQLLREASASRDGVRDDVEDDLQTLAEETAATEASASPLPRGSAVARMEAAGNFFKRYLERGGVRDQKLGEDG